MNTRTRPDITIRIPQLQAQIADLQSQLNGLCHELQRTSAFSQHDSQPLPSEGKGQEEEESAPDRQRVLLQQAQRVVSKHVGDLKKYNEVKDAAMKLLEVLAQQKAMRLKDVLEERGVDCEV